MKKITTAEYKQQVDEILAAMKAEAKPFEKDTSEKKKERLARAKADHFYFFKTYLPHYFPDTFAPFHYELIQLLDKRPNLREDEVLTPVAIAAPREFAKTTITSFGYSLHQICFKLRHFIIIGSDTEDLASDITGYIHLELQYNERIKADFGKLVRPNEAVNDYVTKNDVRILARGRGQRVRGLKHKNWRPDLAILDDMENDKNVQNPGIVKDLLSWTKETVYPGIDRAGNIFIIGTLLAKRSALSQIVAGKDEPWHNWTRRLYRAIQDDKTSLWPQRYTLKQLYTQKELMGSLAFNKEKQNNPIDEDGAFQEEWIRYYPPTIIIPLQLTVVGFWDPSIEVKATSDYKAIITVGANRQEMIFYVMDAFIKRCSIDAALQAAYSRHDEFHYTQFGVEDNLFQKLLLRDFDRLAKEKGYYLPVKGVPHNIAKESRILSLSPLVERGKIQFIKNRGDQDLLIEQMIFYPNSTVHDDGPDALEGAVSLCQEMLGGGEIDYESTGQYCDFVEMMDVF